MSADRDVVVRAERVSKTYRVYHRHGRGWLGSMLMPWARPDRFYRPVDALRDVSFTVRRGEVLGIVGRNGAGKSTLLKIVAGVSRATAGTVEVTGRIRALLSLGVGFHPRFTGRENIVFGSMAMGIARRVAARRMQEIIDFAELREYIDVPVQFYSSGMRARLAAAVAFQESPEILIIDEALAAGDGYFVGKCMQRITEICNSGSTCLFVSHGVSLVERLCDHAMILDQGKVLDEGPASEVVPRYRTMLVEQEARELEARDQGRGLEGAVAVRVHDDRTLNRELITSGRGTVRLVEAWMCDEHGRRARTFENGRPLELHLRLEVPQPIEMARFFVQLYSEEHGVRIAEMGSDHVDAETGRLKHMFLENVRGAYHLTMRWPSNPLGGGPFYFNVFVAPLSTEMSHETAALYHMHVQRVCPFQSISYPGHGWARHRRAVIDPPTTFLLNEDAPHEDPVVVAHEGA